MHLLKLLVLLLMLAVASVASAAPFEAPAGFVELTGNESTKNRMWYSPASIEYYTDYIIVEAILAGPNLGDDKYIAYTILLKPQEKMRRDIRVTVTKVDGTAWGSAFAAPWRSINDNVYRFFGEQLFEQVLKTIADKGLKTLATPAYFTDDMQMFQFTAGTSYDFFSPASMIFHDNHVSVDYFQVYKTPQKGMKYNKRTVMIRPSDKTFQAGPLTSYNEAGQEIATVPGISGWRPVNPSTTSGLLLKELLAYCQRNNIALPGL